MVVLLPLAILLIPSSTLPSFERSDGEGTILTVTESVNTMTTNTMVTLTRVSPQYVTSLPYAVCECPDCDSL